MLNEEVPRDRKDLKIQHYKEKVFQLEEALADARVELTVVSQELRKVRERLAEYENVSEEADAPEESD